MEKYWHRAKSFALQKGFVNDCDDFAQFATMACLRGRRAKLSYLLVDWIRETHGRRAKPAVIPVKPIVIDASYLDYERDAKVVLNFFGPKTQSVFRHYYLDGWTMKEVGEELGVSESRVSQMMKSASLGFRRLMRVKYGPVLLG